MVRTPLNIVVAGPIAATPGQGGSTWAILQYILGLRRLGHRVVFVDPLSSSVLRPMSTTLRDSANASYFMAVVRRFGLQHTSALLLTDAGHETIGLCYADLLQAARDADVLINVSGVLRDEMLLERLSRRVYLDLDPAFTQLWHTVQGIDMGFHNHSDFVTIGPAISSRECDVPSCGLTWLPTWQPIVLEYWPFVPSNGGGALTTIGHWRGYGSIEHNGQFFGQKVHAWRTFMTLPSLTSERIEVALAIDAGETGDLEALRVNKWRLVNPAVVGATPDGYQAFVRASKAELGIAKLGYVISKTGWISDRSLCYLATGRPVLAQETGFSRFIPASDGLLAFETMADLLDAIARTDADYQHHARSARALAEEYFDSDKVLNNLLDRLATPAGTVSGFARAGLP